MEEEYLETLGAAGDLGPNLVTGVWDAVYLDGRGRVEDALAEHCAFERMDFGKASGSSIWWPS